MDTKFFDATPLTPGTPIVSDWLNDVNDAVYGLPTFVSILDFAANGVSGAAVDPTGVLDSTLGIQAALNASHNVVVPIGTYLISSSVTVAAFSRLTFLGGTGNSIGAYPKSYFIKKSTMRSEERRVGKEC